MIHLRYTITMLDGTVIESDDFSLGESELQRHIAGTFGNRDINISIDGEHIQISRYSYSTATLSEVRD